MAYEFKLPDIAEGVHEGEIVQWHVKEGDPVVEDQDMVEVMTDKATVMIKSPKTGTIGQIVVGEGETAIVGDVIVTIVVGGDAGDSAPAADAASDADTATKDEEKTLFDLPADFVGGSKLKKRGGAKAAPAPAAPAPVAQTATGEALRKKTLAAPAIRWDARAKGVDLNTVPASGPNGRVTRADYEGFLASDATSVASAKTPAAAPAVATLEHDEVVPLKGLRKAIHTNMRRSKDHAAHFTYWDEADVTELVRLRADAKGLAEAQGVKLSYLPFVVKAVVAALKRYPDLNAWVDENAASLVRKAEYNIGIATATEGGLMVVVVRDADKRSIFEIARDISELSEKARSGRVSPDDVQGSTFTITSLGKTGGLGATPIINHPEVAILGIHKLEPRAKVNDAREVVVRDCMNISGSYDHRWIDGHIAAEFQQMVIQLLSKPNLLLLGTS